jgi:integrase/recombinase XerD
MVEQTRLSPNTITRRVRSIQAAVRASARREALDQAVAFRFSLVEGVPRSALRERLKTFRALTAPQVRQLCLRPNPTTLLGLRDRSLLLTLASSGARISEAVALRLGDLAPHGASWSVRLLGKGQARLRLAPLTTEAQTWISRWVKARLRAGVDTEVVFTGFVGRYQWPTPQPLGAHAARRRVTAYGRQCDLPHLEPHDLRRFVATQIVQKYGLRAAQLALGHTSAESTLVYLQDELPPGLTEGLI